MSDGASLADILVSQLGTPTDHRSQLLGAGLLLLLLLAYVGFEYGLGTALLRIARSIRARINGRGRDP